MSLQIKTIKFLRERLCAAFRGGGDQEHHPHNNTYDEELSPLLKEE